MCIGMAHQIWTNSVERHQYFMRIIRGSNCEMRVNVIRLTRRNHAHASSMEIHARMACYVMSSLFIHFVNIFRRQLPNYDFLHNNNSSFECNNSIFHPTLLILIASLQRYSHVARFITAIRLHRLALTLRCTGGVSNCIRCSRVVLCAQNAIIYRKRCARFVSMFSYVSTQA